ncbi:hypothetical protein TNCV_3675451 [Trichonephila clavipes]|nr:hypothetical protein TNCV_3675451 [Trichonephila clavipes]
MPKLLRFKSFEQQEKKSLVRRINTTNEWTCSKTRDNSTKGERGYREDVSIELEIELVTLSYYRWRRTEISKVSMKTTYFKAAHVCNHSTKLAYLFYVSSITTNYSLQERDRPQHHVAFPVGCKNIDGEQHPSTPPKTATAGSDVVQSGRPIFDDFFQHLWPYIGNNTANVAFQMVTRLWLIRIDQ